MRNRGRSVDAAPRAPTPRHWPSRKPPATAQCRTARERFARPRARVGSNFRSPEKIVFEDAAQGADAVAPIDLFAFAVGPSVIGDGHFKYRHAECGHFGGDFRFEAETVFLDSYLAD